MKINVVTRVLASALALGFASCGSDNGTTPGNIDAPPPSGTYTHYATNEVRVSPASAQGFDLDGDLTVDNSVGNVLALAAAAGLNVGTILNNALARGAFVLLHSVHASSLTSGSATWQVYLGTPFTNAQTDAGTFPDFSGNGNFTIASTSPTDALLSGTITAGTFSGGPGNVSLQLVFATGAPPIQVNLKGAKIEGDVTANGCSNAKVGGGILASELQNDVFPVLAAILDAAMKPEGCDVLTMCGPPPSTACMGAPCTLETLIDANHDGTITAADIKASFIGTMLAPDLDLVAGVNNPDNASDPKESVSIGIGFSCVKANFTATNEH